MCSDMAPPHSRHLHEFGGMITEKGQCDAASASAASDYDYDYDYDSGGDDSLAFEAGRLLCPPPVRLHTFPEVSHLQQQVPGDRAVSNPGERYGQQGVPSQENWEEVHD